MRGDKIHITLSETAAQKLRAAFPAAHMSLSRKAEKIIVHWLEDSAYIKAADASERRSKGKPDVKAEDLFNRDGHIARSWRLP